MKWTRDRRPLQYRRYNLDLRSGFRRNEEAGVADSPISIMERRREALIGQWIRDPLVMVQVDSPAALPVLVFLDDRGRTAEVGAVGQHSQTDAVIVSRPGDPDRSSWRLGQGDVQGSPHGLCRLPQAGAWSPKPPPPTSSATTSIICSTAPPVARTGRVSFASKPFARRLIEAWGRLFEKDSEQSTLLRQPAPAPSHDELGDLCQACQPESACGPGDARRHRPAGRVLPVSRHGPDEARQGLTEMLKFAYSLR